MSLFVLLKDKDKAKSSYYHKQSQPLEKLNFSGFTGRAVRSKIDEQVKVYYTKQLLKYFIKMLMLF